MKKRYLSLALVSLMFLSGCSKKIECNIQGDHAHQYTTEDGLKFFKNSEYEYWLGNLRNDCYARIDKEIEFTEKNNLTRIDDNEETLKKITDKNPLKVYAKVLKGIVPISGCPIYGWKEINQSEVNEYSNIKYERLTFHGYKEKNNKLVRSQDVYNIFEIKEEYPYIKLNDYYGFVEIKDPNIVKTK